MRSDTSLKLKTKSADQKHTLNTEIGKKESVSTRILVVTEEVFLANNNNNTKTIV